VKKIILMVLVIIPVSAFVGYTMAINGTFPGGREKTEAAQSGGKGKVVEESKRKESGNSDTNKGNTESTTNTEESKNQVTTQQTSGKTTTIKLFFLNKGKTALIEETHEVIVEGGAIMRTSINALIDGPEDNNLERVIPAGTKILSIKREGDVGIIDFSGEFSFENDSLKMLAYNAVEKTLTQISSIKSVKIFVEGSEN
jgi:spore germination protein GerM